MPRYFFHLHNDLDTRDEEGRDLPDLATAQHCAEDDARQMAAESVRDGHLNLGHFVEVTDEGGDQVLRVTFGQVIRVEG